jgi:hypothetical protein
MTDLFKAQFPKDSQGDSRFLRCRGCADQHH